MKTIRSIDILKKIFILNLINISISLYVFASKLPSIEEFKLMCESNDKILQFNNLNLMLSQSKLKYKRRWIRKFNKTYSSPLVYAIFSNNLIIAKIIIIHSLRVGINYNNFTMQDGTSMLTFAAKKNDYKMVTFLLDYHHPIKMDSGLHFSSPVHEAAKQQNTLIFITLRAKQDNCNLIHSKDGKGLTPINYLLDQQKELLVVKIINTCPVDLNNIPKDDKNMTYLHHAVNNQMYELTKQLLIQGFNANQKSYLGSSLDIAQRKQYTSFIPLLQQSHHVADNNSYTRTIYSLCPILNCCIKNRQTYDAIR